MKSKEFISINANAFNTHLPLSDRIKGNERDFFKSFMILRDKLSEESLIERVRLEEAQRKQLAAEGYFVVHSLGESLVELHKRDASHNLFGPSWSRFERTPIVRSKTMGREIGVHPDKDKLILPGSINMSLEEQFKLLRRANIQFTRDHPGVKLTPASLAEWTFLAASYSAANEKLLDWLSAIYTRVVDGPFTFSLDEHGKVRILDQQRGSRSAKVGLAIVASPLTKSVRIF